MAVACTPNPTNDFILSVMFAGFIGGGVILPVGADTGNGHIGKVSCGSDEIVVWDIPAGLANIS